MSAITSIINKPADVTIAGVNLRVTLAFVAGTLMYRADAWFESVVQVIFG